MSTEFDDLKKLLESSIERRGKNERKPSASTWERHVQTVAVGLVMILLLWVGNSIQDLGGAQSETNTKVSLLELEVKTLNNNLVSAIRQYITRQEYNATIENYKYVLGEHRKRIESLENRHVPVR